MELLLRQAFHAGQQWVHDIEFGNYVQNFNDWYNSEEIQKQILEIRSEIYKENQL